MTAARRLLIQYFATLLLGALPIVAAHGEEHRASTGEQDRIAELNLNTMPEHTMPSYFRHSDFWSWQLAHTVIMVLAWTVLMPVAIFLSAARSRYHLPAQVLFHITNGLGVFTGFVYNHSTPDLYVGNSHRPLGWILTGLTMLRTMLSMVMAITKRAQPKEVQASRGLTVEHMVQHGRFHHAAYDDEDDVQEHRDSGQGTERNSASLMGSRQNSSDSIFQKHEALDGVDIGDDQEEAETRGFLGSSKAQGYISSAAGRLLGERTLLAVRSCQLVLEKTLLLLGFATLLSGFIVAGGLFRDRTIFSGLAHYIKGGIFFWYGLLTLGRWMGAFSEFGWAWNIRPQPPVVETWKSRIPSAEFTESFVIWLYGASNVFLEHLNSWDGRWTPSDLEHLSITILFFGGGLLGMLIESGWAQKLLNTSVDVQKSQHVRLIGFPLTATLYVSKEQGHPEWKEPDTYRLPLNPMPALTILLLGMMMGSHHQSSMVSTMMHAQWGALFSAFALARAVTYITLYIKPPTSHYPSRPPSEIVAAFCLVGGGLMFMNSSADTVWAIESNGLDAMTIFTLTMGLTGLVLAWEIVLFALKGWASQRERAAAAKLLPA